MTLKESQISIKSYPECVRIRKGMYINCIEQMVYEIVDNAVDEHAADRCDKIQVLIDAEKGICLIADNGQGIPTNIKFETMEDIKESGADPKLLGLSEAEIAYTYLHAGGKFSNEGAYKTSGGLHGVGAAVVNALSENLILISRRNNKEYTSTFSRGEIVSKMKIKEGINKTGTIVSFTLDKEIWKEEKIDINKVNKRLKQLSFLNPGLEIEVKLKDGDYEIDKKYSSEGITDYIKELTKNRTKISEIIEVNTDIDNIKVSSAFVYTDSYTEDLYSFGNNISTEEGGDHLTGFKESFNKAINEYVKKNNIKENFTPADTREGVVGVISVKLPNPEFEGQGKTKLKAPKLRASVRDAVSLAYLDFLDKNPNTAKDIIEKISSAKRAREAAKRAREAARRTKKIIEGGDPEGLANCSSKKPEECEIYLVEGDSAAGSAKQGRDRHTQAILPVFGKILNTEKSRFSKIVKNIKIESILKALKCGIGDEFNIEKLRYHKIIIMTDADVDGSHIDTLYLTFFYRYMPELIKNGHIYIAQPPLYKVSKGKEEKYIYNDKELEEYLKTIEGKYSLQRYKGLGEMNPEQLWDTTMNPETRILKRIVIEDKEECNLSTETLMGGEVGPRRDFILENANKVSLEDLDI